MLQFQLLIKVFLLKIILDTWGHLYLVGRTDINNLGFVYAIKGRVINKEEISDAMGLQFTPGFLSDIKSSMFSASYGEKEEFTHHGNACALLYSASPFLKKIRSERDNTL